MWDSVRSLPCTACSASHLFGCQVIFLGGHTGLCPFLLGASCIRVGSHPIFGASFRSWKLSRAPFPIKIPFHKTAFTNSLSVLKSSGLSSLVHCFCSLLSWNSRALLICDLFHSDHLPQQQQQPLILFSHIITSSKPQATRYSCTCFMSLQQKAALYPQNFRDGLHIVIASWTHI